MRYQIKAILAFATMTSLLPLYVNCSGLSSASSGSTSQSSLSTSVGTVAGQIPVVGDYASIVSNFDINQYLEPYASPECGPGGDNSMAPDNVGAFRFICNPSHNLYDDPIAFHGQPGASHLHTFFGNTLANGNSTYESLRTTGDGTCEGGPLNRSAYWIPAMMNGAGKVVMPDYTTIYYKRRPKTDPVCAIQGKECVDLPRGLRVIFGYNMGLAANDPAQLHPQWVCDDGSVANGQAEHATIGEAACPVTAHVGAAVSTPDCWDGVHLDSPDHRSHVAFGSYGGWGYYKCPDTHPYVIPQFTLKAWYSHNGPADIANWYLSSDDMTQPRLPAGSTFHSDWFGAWDDDIMKTWSDNAINRMENCSDGQLGNGIGMVRPASFVWQASPRLVDPPVRGATQMHSMSSMPGMPGMSH